MRAMLALRRTLLALIFASLLLPAGALAGGIGGYNMTGFHFGEALREGGGDGRWLDEGGGIELQLGSRTSRIQGRIRFAYNAIIDLDLVADGGGVQHAGIFSGGAQVQLLPDFDEKAFHLYVAVDVGVSPLVTNGRAFVFVDIGPGVRFDVNERFGLFAEVTGWMRYEKGFYGGPMIFLGARVHLD